MHSVCSSISYAHSLCSPSLVAIACVLPTNMAYTFEGRVTHGGHLHLWDSIRTDCANGTSYRSMCGPRGNYRFGQWVPPLKCGEYSTSRGLI